jgi:phytoene synthase
MVKAAGANMSVYPAERLHLARQTLKRHGKSFHWAGLLLAREPAARAATLYAFCRHLDDLADGRDAAAARAGLAAARRDLALGRSAEPSIDAFLRMAAGQPESLAAAVILIDTLAADTGTVQIPTWDDLIRYAYGVASTVGILMCAALDVRNPKALPFAVDLGIAMQLTNIARDVKEDAQRGRVYLPQQASPGELTATGLLEADPLIRQAAQAVIEQVLRRAADYYRSADRGMRFLPWRGRLAILTAARVYEAIGGAVKRRNAYWRGRVYVGTVGKFWHTLRAVAALLGDPRYWSGARPPRHDPVLHRALRGLPGAECTS